MGVFTLSRNQQTSRREEVEVEDFESGGLAQAKQSDGGHIID